MPRARTSVLSVALLSAIIVSVPTGAHAATAIEPGIVVAPVGHDLPAPSVAVADDGRALVVWSGDNPMSDTPCDGSVGTCVATGQLINADGSLEGDEFVIAPDVDSAYYFGPVGVTWNSTSSEWLVTITSYQTAPNAAWVQRVSADGAPIGAARELPFQSVTRFDERSESDVIVDDELAFPVNLAATWSPELEVYLLTWHAFYDGDLDPEPAPETPTFGSEFGYLGSAFGMFLDADLTSSDGVEAAFIISDDGVGAAGNRAAVEVGYDPTESSWLVTWIPLGDDGQRGVHIDFATGITIGPMISLTSTSEWDVAENQGSVVWAPALGRYIITWGGRELPSDDLAYWGRTVDGDTLGPIVTLSELQPELEAGGTVRELNRLTRSSAAVSGDTLHLSAQVRYGPAISRQFYRAILWSVDLATFTPTDPVSLVASGDGESSRPRLDAGSNGATRVVWQDWPNGFLEGPWEVRTLDVAEMSDGATDSTAPELADTGAAEVGTLAALVALLVGAGAVLVLARPGGRARRSTS